MVIDEEELWWPAWKTEAAVDEKRMEEISHPQAIPQERSFVPVVMMARFGCFELTSGRSSNLTAEKGRWGRRLVRRTETKATTDVARWWRRCSCGDDDGWRQSMEMRIIHGASSEEMRRGMWWDVRPMSPYCTNSCIPTLHLLTPALVRAQPSSKAKLDSGISLGPGSGGLSACAKPGLVGRAGNQTFEDCMHGYKLGSVQVTKHAHMHDVTLLVMVDQESDQERSICAVTGK